MNQISVTKFCFIPQNSFHNKKRCYGMEINYRIFDVLDELHKAFDSDNTNNAT